MWVPIAECSSHNSYDLPDKGDTNLKLWAVVLKSDDDVEDHGDDAVEQGDGDGGQVADEQLGKGILGNGLAGILQDRGRYTITSFNHANEGLEQ